MKLTGYRVNEERRLEQLEVELEDLVRTSASEPIWVDVQDADPRELLELLRPLDLHPLAHRACMAPADRTFVEPFENAVVLSYPLGGVADLEVSFARVLCLPRLLLTIREGIELDLDSDASRGTTRLPAASVTALLLYLLDLNQEGNIRTATVLRDQVTALAERIEDDLESVEGGEVRDLKRRTAGLAALFEDQLACVGKLGQLETGALDLTDLHEYYLISLSTIEYLERMTGRIDSQVKDARHQYQSALQDKTNRRLNVLTIVQAVFVPLSFLAGLYGMNFMIPGADWPPAFWICLLGMGVIVAVELWIFYRQGWFD